MVGGGPVSFPSAAYDRWKTTEPEPAPGVFKCRCEVCTWDDTDGTPEPACRHVQVVVERDEDGPHSFCLCCQTVVR